LRIDGRNCQWKDYILNIYLLGRAGCLDEAYRLILKMPFRANAAGLRKEIDNVWHTEATRLELCGNEWNSSQVCGR
jgi:hypothetical protein